MRKNASKSQKNVANKVEFKNKNKVNVEIHLTP